MIRIKIRIAPYGGQRGTSYGIGERGIFYIYCIAHRFSGPAVLSNRAAPGNRCVIYALVQLAIVIQPTLDDLYAVEVTTSRIKGPEVP